MVDFFFYGTLIDADIRRLVLGRDVPDAAMRPAELPGFRRTPVQGQPYPAAVPEAGSVVDGMVMAGASLTDAAILSCFEGADYEATPCTVTLSPDNDQSRPDRSDAAAWVFVASERVLRARGQWLIDDWRANHKPAFLAIADRWLDGISDTDIKNEERRWRQRLGAL